MTKISSETLTLENSSALPTIDQLIDLEVTIHEEIETLNGEIETSRLEIEAISPETSIGQHSRNSVIQMYEMAVAGLRRREQRLAALEAALERMDEGEFGNCEICHQGIAWARLEVQPEALRCSRCA
ncbi:MAG: TraR/DksA C4-type zinc finger protein [Verrucomicrobiales bacterium]|nr:TraR/DksA C4-type zinc finger protein [Verrucomicrobiales bacterium]